MPIYEYLRDKCGSLTEKIQKISDAPLTQCEKCDGKLNKILSHSSFVLKGSGWYLTDYSKKSSTEAKSETKTETKTEAKPETSGSCGSGGCGANACSTTKE